MQPTFHAASELAFFLALAERPGDRSYDIVDVTNLHLMPIPPDGTSAAARPVGAVDGVLTDRLVAQLETARPISPQEAGNAGRLWQHSRTHNAPFRVVTPTGLASARIDHVDSSILEQAAREWRSSAYIIGSTIAHACEPYRRVGHVLLLARSLPWSRRASSSPMAIRGI